MEFYTYNLKEFSPSVELAEAMLLIEIENAKKSKIKGIKFIHGYGSHNVGGSICLHLKSLLPRLKKQGKIKDFIPGIDWNMAHQTTFNFIKSCPSASLDEDLNHFNIGVSIVIL
ncbi:MAG: hypothetical protein IKT27_01170 [Clostridia bacterium]|nr:hypothetical protein [Clostridia bacterium]